MYFPLFFNFLHCNKAMSTSQSLKTNAAPSWCDSAYIQAGVTLFSVDYSALTRKDEEEERETFSVETLLGFGERQRKSIIV